MREDDAEEERNWFARWEDELPTPDELIPLSQSLITPNLALAFDIPTPHPPPPPPDPIPAGSDTEPARTLKRPRLVWTPQLHKRFVDAVAHLGIKNAVPKTIMQLMSVDGLTRENVASHLQKYRLYLKRMQGINSGPPGAQISAADHHLFASTPVNHHLLPYVPVTALQHHQHLAAQYYHQRQFGSAPGFDHGFLGRPHRMVVPPGLLTDLDSGSGDGGKRVLTLFPTADD